MNKYISALFTKHKKKHLPSFLTGTWFDEWMSYGYITFSTAFILQGMLYANWRDNVIKIGLDIIITLLLSLMIPWYWGLLIAHIINFAINGQLICVFYHIQAGNKTAQEFYNGTIAMKKRLDKCKYIQAAIGYGSLSTGKWKPSSDIDIRFIPESGEWNYWMACFWSLGERTRAFFTAFPLDMYIFSMKHCYNTMSKNELPIIFTDAHDIVSPYYKSLMSFEEFDQMFTKLHLNNNNEGSLK